MFVVVHAAGTRTPRLVLQAVDLAAARAVPRVDRFHDTARLRQAGRSTPADDRASGHGRGHLTPAAKLPTVSVSAQGFLLASVVPQVPAHKPET